jgi:4-hydroxy-3-methylbut-2-enyl diphosphate reductase
MSQMEVIVAKTAGFCFGVKRAVEQVYRQIEEGVKPIYTYGPIIHNEEVVRELSEKGVQIIDGEADIAKITGGTVIIRSHGVSRRVYELLEQSQARVIDATCPFVKKIHRIVDEHSAQGAEVIIIGNDGHPEVEGIKGWCNGRVTVVGSEKNAEKFRRKGETPL